MTPALTDLIAEFNNAESFFGENKISIESATNTKFSNNDFVPAWSNQEMCCNCTFEIRLGDRPCYEKVLENVKKGETEKDYVEGYECVGPDNTVRKVKGWVEKELPKYITPDGTHKIGYCIQADDEFEGHRGTYIFTSYGPITKLEYKPRI